MQSHHCCRLRRCEGSSCRRWCTDWQQRNHHSSVRLLPGGKGHSAGLAENVLHLLPIDAGRQVVHHQARAVFRGFVQGHSNDRAQDFRAIQHLHRMLRLFPGLHAHFARANDTGKSDLADLCEVILQFLPLAAGWDPVDDHLAAVLGGFVCIDGESRALEQRPIQLGHGSPSMQRGVIPHLTRAQPATRARPPASSACAFPRCCYDRLPCPPCAIPKCHSRSREPFLIARHDRCFAIHPCLAQHALTTHCYDRLPSPRRTIRTEDRWSPEHLLSIILHLCESHRAYAREVVFQLLPLDRGWKTRYDQTRVIL
mmetsp:Transcript_2171/g.4970  ORF Transcript_2171/g.4970 Transcript_2171/m.4970 type:complete len:312 (-) Transcript_2171:188-1123(-)